MGVFDGVRNWWRDRFGSGAADDDDEAEAETESTDESADTPGYECAICGTAVDGPEASCPVCRSGDIVAAGRDAESTSTPMQERRYAEGSDDPVDRLQRVRDSGEILGRHEDRWTEADGEFHVETPDGEVTVASRVEVAALLEEHYK